MKISVPIDYILPYADEWESIGEREKSRRKPASVEREQIQLPVPEPEMQDDAEARRVRVVSVAFSRRV